MSNPKDKLNPANEVDLKLAGKDRIPMSIPIRHLEVGDIPGYHQHWFVTSRVSRALRAGYTFVTEEDGVDINNFDLAGDATANGSTDMGTRFSVPAAVGGDSEERLYLMKLPEELWLHDQGLLEERNERIAASIRGEKAGGLLEGPGGPNPYDGSNQYRSQSATMFTPKRRPR